MAITALMQLSIEDIVMGGLPGIPKVRFLNPFYSFENADEYIKYLDSFGTLEMIERKHITQILELTNWRSKVRMEPHEYSI